MTRRPPTLLADMLPLRSALPATWSRRPTLVDLFCSGGGGAMGYWLAGFDVIGVDIVPQPHYPFPMVIGDADDWRRAMEIDWLPRDRLSQAIPPAYTRHIGEAFLNLPPGAPVAPTRAADPTPAR